MLELLDRFYQVGFASMERVRSIRPHILLEISPNSLGVVQNFLFYEGLIEVLFQCALIYLRQNKSFGKLGRTLLIRYIFTFDFRFRNTLCSLEAMFYFGSVQSRLSFHKKL